MIFMRRRRTVSPALGAPPLRERADVRAGGRAQAEAVAVAAAGISRAAERRGLVAEVLAAAGA
jgi:hypothetical protein